MIISLAQCFRIDVRVFLGRNSDYLRLSGGVLVHFRSPRFRRHHAEAQGPYLFRRSVSQDGLAKEEGLNMV